jgi:hypothetical protein
MIKLKRGKLEILFREGAVAELLKERKKDREMGRVIEVESNSQELRSRKRTVDLNLGFYSARNKTP